MGSVGGVGGVGSVGSVGGVGRSDYLGMFFTEKLWSLASPFKGIKKEHIPYFKPPYCRVTDN